MRRDKVEQAISVIGRGLHQDALIDNPSMGELVQSCLNYMSETEQKALKEALAFAFEDWTNAELKGVLNRAKTDIRFNSKGTRIFLKEVFRQLSDA